MNEFSLLQRTNRFKLNATAIKTKLLQLFSKLWLLQFFKAWLR